MKDPRPRRPCTVIVFGASGDLARRKTFPALYELYKAHLNLTIYGFARSDRPNFTETLVPYLPKGCDDFLSRIHYRQAKSYADTTLLQEILSETQSHLLICYLAIPPSVFLDTCRAIRQVVKSDVRLVLEKPFGHDLTSCRRLLSELGHVFPEQQMYRIDHYLFKDTVEQILHLRKNQWLNWKPKAIHVLWKERIGIEGRSYFDEAGIVRDVIQNHLLQVLSLVTMDTSIEDVRAAKVSILKSIKVTNYLLGQYNGYRDDPGVKNKQSLTPTYAAVSFCVNTPHWKACSVVIEAGKALDEDLCEVRLLWDKSTLVLRLQPDASIFVTTSRPNRRSTTLTLLKPKSSISPYGKLLADVYCGNQARFVHSDELLEAWRIVDTVLKDRIPKGYDMGTQGPKSRDNFLEEAGIQRMTLPHSRL